MDWFSATFGLSLQNLGVTRGFDDLPTLDEQAQPNQWLRLPAPVRMPFAGLFLSVCPTIDELLQLDERGFADLFHGVMGVSEDATGLVDGLDLVFGDALVARLGAGLEGRLPGVPEQAVAAWREAELQPEDLTVAGWLVPPAALVPETAVIHLDTMRSTLQRYTRLRELRAPDLLLVNDLRKIQNAQLDLLNAVRSRVLAKVGKATDWRLRQQQLRQRLDELLPGDRVFEADLARGVLSWSSTEHRVEAQAWLLGSHRAADSSFQPGWEVPGAVAIAPNEEQGRSASSEEEAFALAWRHAQLAGLRYLFRIRTENGLSLFVGLLEPELTR